MAELLLTQEDEHRERDTLRELDPKTHETTRDVIASLEEPVRERVLGEIRTTLRGSFRLGCLLTVMERYCGAEEGLFMLQEGYLWRATKEDDEVEKVAQALRGGDQPFQLAVWDLYREAKGRGMNLEELAASRA